MFRCWRCWARVKLFSTKADADWDKPSWQVWDDPYALRSVSMKYLHFSLSSVGQLSTMDIIKPPVARETCVFWLVGSGCWRRLKTSERLLWLDYHLNCHKAVQKTKKQAKKAHCTWFLLWFCHSSRKSRQTVRSGLRTILSCSRQGLWQLSVCSFVCQDNTEILPLVGKHTSTNGLY